MKSEKMQIKIKRIDKTLPLPSYATTGACCFDLQSRKKIAIRSRQLGLIPLNIIIEVPTGYMFIVVPRSSTPRKKSLLIPHGIGIIDQDYNGPEDEILLQVLNFSDEEVVVEKGERLAQGCLIPIEKADFIEVEKISEKSRGGYGSTG